MNKQTYSWSRVLHYALLSVLGLCLTFVTACSDDDPSPSPRPETVDASKYALVDLHLHLDGSLTPEDVLQMAQMGGNVSELPSTDLNELKKALVCPEDNKDLTEYLKCFDLPLKVMQSRATIAYSVKSLVKRLDKQGLIYAEIRFAPQLHTQKGLTQDEVVQAALEGLQQGISEAGGIKANLILCCMRGDGTNDAANYETIDLTKKYLGNGVVATDLAGAEALFPTSYYQPTFAYAKQQGVPFTIHAGEADGVVSMNLALDYGAKRIGHGIRCYNDLATQARLKELDVCLDLCPKSNLDTHALAGVTTIAQYPLQTLLLAGVPVTINTDDMTVSNTDLKSEFKRLFEANLLTAQQAEHIVETSIEHAFLPANEKALLLAKAKERMK